MGIPPRTRAPNGRTRGWQSIPPLTPTTTPLGARAHKPHAAGYRQPLYGESGRGRLSPAPGWFIGSALPANKGSVQSEGSGRASPLRRRRPAPRAHRCIACATLGCSRPRVWGVSSSPHPRVRVASALPAAGVRLFVVALFFICFFP